MGARPGDQPVAPEPEWPPEERHFHPSIGGTPFSREKFLLRIFGLALMMQYLMLLLYAAVCEYNAVLRIRLKHSPPPPEAACHRVDNRVDATFQLSISTILALLGGSALAASGTKPPSDPGPRRRP